MGVRNVQHILIETTDVEKSTEFWLGLGFQLQKVWLGGTRRYIRLVADGAWVVLTKAPEGEEPGPPVLHFAADRPERLYEWAQQSEHVEVLSKFVPVDRETQTMRVRDPDGRIFAIDAPMPDPLKELERAKARKKRR